MRRSQCARCCARFAKEWQLSAPGSPHFDTYNVSLIQKSLFTEQHDHIGSRLCCICACALADVERVPGTPMDMPLRPPGPENDDPAQIDLVAASKALLPTIPLPVVTGLQARQLDPRGLDAAKPAAPLSGSLAPVSFSPSKLPRSSQGLRLGSRQARQGGPARSPTPPLSLHPSTTSPVEQPARPLPLPDFDPIINHHGGTEALSSSLVRQPGRVFASNTPKPAERGALPLTSSPAQDLNAVPANATSWGVKGALPLTRSPSPKHEALNGASAQVLAAAPIQHPLRLPAAPAALAAQQPGMHREAVHLVSPKGLQAAQLRQHMSMTVEDKMHLWDASKTGISPGSGGMTPTHHFQAALFDSHIPASAMPPAVQDPGSHGDAAAPEKARAYAPDSRAPVTIGTTPEAELHRSGSKAPTSVSGTPFDDSMFNALDAIEQRYHMEQGRAQAGEMTHPPEIQQPILLPPSPCQLQQQTMIQPMPPCQQFPKLPSIQQPAVMYPPPLQHSHNQHEQQLQQRVRVAAQWLGTNAPVLPACPSPTSAPGDTDAGCPGHAAPTPCLPQPRPSTQASLPAAAPAAGLTLAGATHVRPEPPPSVTAPFQFPVPALAPYPREPALLGTSAAALALQHSQPSGVPPGAAVFRPCQAQLSQLVGERRPSLSLLAQPAQLEQGLSALPQPPPGMCLHPCRASCTHKSEGATEHLASPGTLLSFFILRIQWIWSGLVLLSP